MVKKKPEPRREAKGKPLLDALDKAVAHMSDRQVQRLPICVSLEVKEKIEADPALREAFGLPPLARRPAAKLPVCKACGQRHKPNTSGTTPDGKWIRERRYCPAKLYRTRPAAKRSAK